MSASPQPMTEAPAPRAEAALDHEVVIIGSGFSGLGAAVELQKMGIQDFMILEREKELGGTWVQHDYPGLEVDMPFFIYSYPFEMKADWSQVYPTGQEMKEYTLHCADKYDLVRRIRCGTAVESAVWDEQGGVWRIHLESGQELVSRYLVNATGLLVIPKLPDIEGIEDFQGTLIHTARWNWDHDLTNERVAVIGTGATAIQVIPAIVDSLQHLDIYQRTPIWLLPKPNPALSRAVQKALRVAPFLQTLTRWLTNLFVEIVMGMGHVRYKRFPGIFAWVEKKATEYVRGQVQDPETAEKLIPHYNFFCKRPSFSNTFYEVFNRPEVDLVTDPIERITTTGIQTRDGTLREVDTLICATGYNVFDRKSMPGYELVGCNGVNLGDFWQKSRFQAYEGATIPSFPNLFLFMGPYSASGASYFTMIDTQGKHMSRCLKEARRRGANRIEVKQAPHDLDFEKIKRRRESTVLFGGHCAGSNSYYFDGNGDAPGLRPVTGFEHWLKSRFFDMASYSFDRR